MRDYEVVYILRSSLTSEEIEDRLDRYHQKILVHADAEITAVEHWGKRQLAYPIDKNENGYYVVAQFTTGPSVLPEYERVLKLDDGLLRHLVVLSEGQLPIPPSMLDASAQAGVEAKTESAPEAGVEAKTESAPEAGVEAKAESAPVDDDAGDTADGEEEQASEDVPEVVSESEDPESAAEEDEIVVEEEAEEETVRSEES